MIALPVAASLLAAIVIGGGPGVDCKVGSALTQAFVPYRVIVRATHPFADNRAAMQTALSKILHTSPDDLTITPIGSDAFVVDSKNVDISLSPLFAEPNDDRFQYIVRDPYIRTHSGIDTDDPYFHSIKHPLWGLQAIRAPEAWNYSKGSADIVVAVVDGGISPDHEDLKPLWASTVAVGNCPAGFSGYDAIDNKCQIQVRSAHGTEMAGTIGAHAGNQHGVVGVNWYVSLLSSAFTDRGIGCASSAVNALHFVSSAVAAGVNVRVVNLSWGTSVDEPTIRTELQTLSDLGVVLVASAGNDGDDLDASGKKMYPASYPLDTLIAVAATEKDKSLVLMSNRGKTTVHIAAPGQEIVTTSLPTPATYNLYTTGTSIAAAHVTGAIALLASKCPSATGKQLKDLVLKNPQPVAALDGLVADKRFLDIAAAIAAAIDPVTGQCKAFQ